MSEQLIATGMDDLADLVTRAKVRVLAREWEGDWDSARLRLGRYPLPRWMTDDWGWDVWLGSTEIDLWDIAVAQLDRDESDRRGANFSV